MKLYTSKEDYLEAIFLLTKNNQEVRSIDLARHMGFSKPSISNAVAGLKEDGFLTVNEEGHLKLTVEGEKKGREVYEKHIYFKEMLVGAGVDPELAEKEACGIEHVVSYDTFQKIKKKLD
ncbi:Mn-dependent DtxR family transcriptional regulator [Aequitasia blattaphilus]|uniref:Metal-dependent transcriptional regulator n=1 Tax=Aequitasia blattaphilus TaxID=2949332 RepID=A0ABT1EFS9_9FIRM|nr:metal-dependent transcriptional regulator [Aequitasia blattaphilus]MCP1103312.1 metal-dependent transcriptional regulator [Aequitasia blattaphilus]MCR8615952.1 metal-dependent transcriptional regulator [Aequitasia blattaphilus]